MNVYRSVVKPLFFLINPEKIHRIIISVLQFCYAFLPFRWLFSLWYGWRKDTLKCTVAGMEFPNPLGIAAGFDKGGHLAGAASMLGFGFTEIGSITPLAQPGNPKPRLFRLPKDSALINRMGFNSEGADLVAARLNNKAQSTIPIGVSLAKNTNTPNEDALQDYREGIKRFHKLASFFVVNVSCPNVTALTQLQEPNAIAPLLRGIMTTLQELKCQAPLFVKLSPDQTPTALTHTVQVALQEGVTGFILVNTTNARDHLYTPQSTLDEIGNGGLSGLPLFEKTLHNVQLVRKIAGPRVPIIAVGGIGTGEQALQLLQAGANLLQIFTAYIYEGPRLPRRILRYLNKHRREIPLWNA